MIFLQDADICPKLWGFIFLKKAPFQEVTLVMAGAVTNSLSIRGVCEDVQDLGLQQTILKRA